MDTISYTKTTWALFKKELLNYFNSPIAYIFIAVFLIIGNWLFFNPFFLRGVASMRPYFNLLPWIFLFITPAITMRLWAEERKSGTAELLLTFPVSNWQIVLAKFLSSLVFVAIALALTVTLPITVANLGNMDIGPVIGGYLGALFLAGAYLALGLFISGLTKNQIVAFVASLAACFLAFVVGADFVLIKAPSFIAPVMKFLGLGSHFDSIARGVIDSKDIIYYLSFIFVFLWFNVQFIGRRDWS